MSDPINELLSIFPHIDRPVLKQVLELHSNDVEESIEYLLNHPSNMSILANLGLNDDVGFENEAIPPKRHIEKFVEISSKQLLATALATAVNDPTFSDVILVTSDNKEVHAHQFILAARSEYLQVLLSSIPVEKGKKKRLEMEMKENHLIKVVQYLYTDQAQLADEELHGVYLVAQQLGLDRLRQLCEQADDAFLEPSTFNTDFLTAFKALNFKHFDALEGNKIGDGEADLPYLETDEDKQRIRSLKEDFNSDVTLIINQKPVHCHKIILVSSCEYFKAMFMGFMKEKELTEIKLEDCPDFDSFLIMLECIYMNGRLRENQVTPANALGVFLAANQFMVPSLQKYCEKIIKDNLDTETVCELLDITDALSESMKHICLQYIFSHYQEVIGTPEYQKLSEALKMEIQQRFEQESQNSLISFFRAVAHQDVDDIKLAIKTEILTFLEDQFDIGEIETEFEDVTGSPIGEINYTVTEMVMRQPDDMMVVDPDDVIINFTSTKLEIEVKKWTAIVESLDWSYRQLAFPNLSDDGKASAKILGGGITLIFDVVSPIMGIPSIKVHSLDIKVNGIEIYIKEAKAAWLYNILMKLFSTQIKTTMETALNVMLTNSVEDLVQNINKRGLQMVANSDLDM